MGRLTSVSFCMDKTTLENGTIGVIQNEYGAFKFWEPFFWSQLQFLVIPDLRKSLCKNSKFLNFQDFFKF